MTIDFELFPGPMIRTLHTCICFRYYKKTLEKNLKFIEIYKNFNYRVRYENVTCSLWGTIECIVALNVLNRGAINVIYCNLLASYAHINNIIIVTALLYGQFFAE